MYSVLFLVSLIRYAPRVKCSNSSYCFDWLWHCCIVNQSILCSDTLFWSILVCSFFVIHLAFWHYYNIPFSICFCLFAHLLSGISSSSPTATCKLSLQSPSHSKLFARTATGVVMLKGEPQVFLFDFQESLFLHSQRWGKLGVLTHS